MSAVASEVSEHQTRPFFNGMGHEGDTAYWVTADSTYVQVWTFRPCSEEEAATMEAMLEDEPHVLNVSSAIKLYQDATGREGSYVQ